MALHPSPTIETDLALISARITHSSVGRTAECTFALNNAGHGAAQGVVNAFNTDWKTHIKPVLDTDCTMELPFVRLGNGGTTPTEAVANNGTAAGTRAINPLPPSTCALAKKNTNVGGRHNRGRTYLPWALEQGDVDIAGTIDPTTRGNLQTAFDALLADLTTHGIDLVIANKTLAVDGVTGKKYVTAITTGFAVTAWTVEQTIATQRRRMARL